MTKGDRKAESFNNLLALIRRRWPVVAAALSRREPAAWVNTQNGPTLRIRDGDGRTVTLFTPRDPGGKAREFLVTHAGGKPRSPAVLLGLGAGHRVPALLEMLPPAGALYGVIVNRGAFLSGVFEGVLSDALRDPRLELLLGDQAGLASLANVLETEEGTVFPHGPALRVAENFARETVRLADIIGTYGNRAQVLIRRIRENYRINLERLGRDTPLRRLEGLLSGSPVLVAGAGPSLEKGVKELAPYRERVFLIAVEAAIRPLFHQGITADLAVSVDPFDTNAAQCRDLPHYPPLVYMPSVHPEVLENWRGRKVAALPTHDPVAEELNRELNIGLLDSGGIVGTVAVVLASFMGGAPLILLGMDLAFPGGRSHAFRKDTAVEAGPSPYQTRVTAVDGGSVATNATFRRAISWFELFARSQPRGVCVDAGKIGALKVGFEPRSLETILSPLPPAPRPELPLPE